MAKVFETRKTGPTLFQSLFGAVRSSTLHGLFSIPLTSTSPCCPF